jgi:glycine/D-amino acid oxidase-like deaminating enzyme
MMHAAAARQRGYQVTHLEREAGPRGASVRNFGLIWVSGRAPGSELALALRARELSEKLAAVVPAVNPALRGAFSCGLLCTRDAIVEPRQVPAAIRDYLIAGGSGRGHVWLPGREGVEIAPGAVRDHIGTWHRGDLVILCPGAAHTGIVGPHLSGYDEPPVRRVRLQMLQTEPFDRQLTTSVADGDSLRYYPGYDLPSRGRLAPQRPVAAAARAQLLLAQRLDGSLTIGDAHAYDEPFAFDLDEAPCDHLRTRAEQLLGQPPPPTRRRWAGVYSQVTGPCRAAQAGPI